MKKAGIVIVVFGLFFMIHASASSRELSSRKGFIFTLEIPGVGISYHEDQDDGPVFSMAAALRFGYGISERFVLFLEQASSIGPMGDMNRFDEEAIIFWSLSVGVQYFLISKQNFFMTPKVGMGWGEVWNESNRGPRDREGAGFAGGLGVGHEWRLGKSFALSPELRFDYYNTHGAHAYFSGLVLNLQWY